MNSRTVQKIVKARDIVGPSNFMVENHEKLINLEAKVAEEEMNDPKKKKGGGGSRNLQRRNSVSSRGSYV